MEAKGKNAMRLFSRGTGSLLELSNIVLYEVACTFVYSDYNCYADDFIFVGALSIAELLRWDCLLSHMNGTSTCDAMGL